MRWLRISFGATGLTAALLTSAVMGLLIAEVAAGMALAPTATTVLPASTATFPAIPLRKDFLSNAIWVSFLSFEESRKLYTETTTANRIFLGGGILTRVVRLRIRRRQGHSPFLLKIRNRVVERRKDLACAFVGIIAKTHLYLVI